MTTEHYTHPYMTLKFLHKNPGAIDPDALMDYVSWDMALDYSTIGGSEVLYHGAYFQEKPSADNAWIWKISQVEMDTNPNLTEADQN